MDIDRHVMDFRSTQDMRVRNAFADVVSTIHQHNEVASTVHQYAKVASTIHQNDRTASSLHQYDEV